MVFRKVLCFHSERNFDDDSRVNERGRSTHPEGSRMMPRAHSRSLPYDSVFRLFKSLDSRHIYSCASRVGYVPVCKCELRLPGGATSPPDCLTRPAEPRCVINVVAGHTQRPLTAPSTHDRAFAIAIVKTRLVNFSR